VRVLDPRHGNIDIINADNVIIIIKQAFGPMKPMNPAVTPVIKIVLLF
jgi:hypothetical protein